MKYSCGCKQHYRTPAGTELCITDLDNRILLNDFSGLSKEDEEFMREVHDKYFNSLVKN
jgi:hypothetical protein